MRQSLTLGVGERADLWVDFATAQPGDEISLIARPFAPMISGSGGMPMMGRPANIGPRAIAPSGSAAAPPRSLRPQCVFRNFLLSICAKPSTASGLGESKCR